MESKNLIAELNKIEYIIGFIRCNRNPLDVYKNLNLIGQKIENLKNDFYMEVK